MATWPPPASDSSVPPRPGGSPSGRSFPPGGVRDPYPQDPYERDGFGRERYYDYAGRGRDWEEWERRRAQTRYRSRSPGFDDGRRKRRRSASPYDRDRYDTRPRYDDDYRGGRARSPNSSRSRIPDPYDYDVAVGIRHFTDWWQANHQDEAATDETTAADGVKEAEPHSVMRARYEKYRKHMLNKQLSIMFQYHKSFPWFNEKYNPSSPFVNLRCRVRREGWDGRVDKFVRELEEGKYDPLETNKDEKETLDSVTGNPSNGDPDMSTAIDEPKVDEAAEVDEDPPTIENAAELNGNGKRPESPSPAEGTKMRDEEISVMPEGNQVLIRTIPPDIGRAKIEKACRDIPGFIHLGLGDTMQKKNYYRAGWIKFADDAEMTGVIDKLSEAKIEGFKLHVTHSTRPFRSRARRTPESASEPERIEKDLANVKILASILEEEAYHLQTLPEKLPEPKYLKQSNGGELPDDSDAALTGDTEPAVDSEMILEPTREHKDRGTEALNKRLEKLLHDLNEKHMDEGLSGQTVKNIIELDLYMAYLRIAFNCCYYCLAITDHEEELQRQCIKHVRTPKRSSEPVKDDRWGENLDQRIALLIDRDNVDPRDYGGKLYDEELTKAVEPHVKQEEEGKFRCKACNKLFKAMSFMQKHVSGKHPDLVQQLDDISFFNNFALDPRRIAPFSHTPPPSGGGQQAPAEAYGLRSRHVETRGRSNSGSFGSYPLPQYAGYYPGWPDYYGRHYDQYPPPRGYGYDVGPRGRSRSPPPFSGPLSRKLSDRLGDFAPGPGISRGGPPPIEGLPPKPISSAKLEPGPHSKRRRGVSMSVDPMSSGPPPNAKEDPRAAAGRKVSYYDIDKMAEGDVELSY